MSRNRFSLRSSHLAALCSIAVLVLAAQALATQPQDADLSARIDTLAKKALDSPVGAGLSVAVARDGKVIHAAGYGLAEIEHGVEANAETTFRIGSITKQFSAAAILQLVEQGKLSLDDELDKFFPDFPTHGHTVTVRHLLNHTSGIPSYTEAQSFWTDSARELSVDELLDTVRDSEFDFAPGDQWKYNNTAYYMLGPIIEQASGKPYAQYISELVEPLSLSRTRCDSNTDIIANRAQGYGVNGGKLVNDNPIGMNNPGAAGMMIASARDLVAWKLALMDGRVVSEQLLKQMTTPHTLPDGSSTKYGFGLGINEFHGHKRIAHGGGINGFNSMLAFYPDDGVCIAVISNGGVNSGRLTDDIASAVLGIEVGVQDLPVGERGAASISGTYVFEELPFEITVYVEDDKAYIKAEGQPTQRLLYQGRGEFLVEADQSIRIKFDPPTGGGTRCPSLTLHQNGEHIANRKTDDDDK